MFKKKLEDVPPTGDEALADWVKIEEGFNKLAEYYAKTDAQGPFILGETVSWADISVVSFKLWMKWTFGEDSEEWKRISAWSGGRWENLVKALEKYTTIVWRRYV